MKGSGSRQKVKKVEGQERRSKKRKGQEMRCVKKDEDLVKESVPEGEGQEKRGIKKDEDSGFRQGEASRKEKVKRGGFKEV